MIRSVIVLSRPLGSRDPAERLRRVLAELGCDVRAATDGESMDGEGEAVIVWGNASWFPRTWASLASAPPTSRPTVALWQSEPLPYVRGSWRNPRLTARELMKRLLRDPRATDPYSNAATLRRLAAMRLPDVLVVTSEDKAEYLAEQGLWCDAVILRGYDRSLGTDLELDRDIDVLFLGARDVPRRKRALRRLHRRGVAVRAVGSWADPAYWGEERTQLLNRTRILLNVSRHPGQFSGERLLLGMANGTLVVSEPMYRPDPFVPGRHFVSAPLDRFPAVIAHYLSHEDERRAIAARGGAFVAEELTLRRGASRVLDLIERSRAVDGL